MRAVAAVVQRLPLHRSPFAVGLAARTSFFDRQVLAAIDDGIGQVVILGAGYDSRAWRFRRDGARYFELDHPATQLDKRRRAPADGPAYVAADLDEASPISALRASGFDVERPAVFVVEGVSMYLTAAAVHHLLSALAADAAPGSRLAINFAPPRSAGRFGERARQHALGVLGSAGRERHVFFLGLDRAAAFVASTGWQPAAVRSLAELAAEARPADRMRIGRLNRAAAAVAAISRTAAPC